VFGNNYFPRAQIHRGIFTMTLAIRIFALFVVVAGATAAVLPKATPSVPSRQAATSSLPTPGCGPHMGCPVGN